MKEHRIGTCTTCAFFLDAKGVCTLNPPTVIMMPDGRILSRCPEVDNDDSCSFWTSALRGGRRKTYQQQLQDGDA